MKPLKKELLMLTKDELDQLCEVPLLEEQKKHISICLFNQQPITFDDLIKIGKLQLVHKEKSEYIKKHDKLYETFNLTKPKQNNEKYLLKELL